MPAGLFDHLPRFAQLLQRIRDERLAAEARIDTHDEQKVDLRQDPLHGGKRCCGIQGNAGFFPKFMDLLYGPVEVPAGFRMHGDDIGAAVRKFREIPVRILNHEMHVEDPVRHRTERADHRHAEGDRRNEGTVHHVDMDILRAGPVHREDVIGKVCEIS